MMPFKMKILISSSLNLIFVTNELMLGKLPIAALVNSEFPTKYLRQNVSVHFFPCFLDLGEMLNDIYQKENIKWE